MRKIFLCLALLSILVFSCTPESAPYDPRENMYGSYNVTWLREFRPHIDSANIYTSGSDTLTVTEAPDSMSVFVENIPFWLTFYDYNWSYTDSHWADSGTYYMSYLVSFTLDHNIHFTVEKEYTNGWDYMFYHGSKL